MTSTPIVQSLWIGPRLPVMQQLSIASFLAHGHDYHLYTYGPLDDVPAGATVLDGNEVIPGTDVFRNATRKTYAAFSNYFRYRLLLLRGGWWVDTDLVCLRRFDFEASYVFSSEHSQEQPGNELINVGAIKAPPGAPAIAYADAVCWSKNPTELAWGEVGPALMADAVRRYSLESYVVSPLVFCPLPWFRFTDLFDHRKTFEFPPESYAVHLWNELWRQSRFHSGAAYHPDCTYEIWKERYLPRTERLACG